MPLVVLLHGYTATGALQELYFKLQPLAQSRGFLYVHPDGLVDAAKKHFWNATDACCDLYGKTVDDSKYLTAVIESVQRRYNVDAHRIFLVGHSNGAFMSYRMACDHADKIAAMVSLAGATFADPQSCTPSAPVSVLELHGTADTTIVYKGGSIVGHRYPSAPITTSTWAGYDGCDPRPSRLAIHHDMVTNIAGDETSVSQYVHCRSGSDVELWTIAGAGHVPPLSDSFASSVIDFLFAHPKA